MSNKLDATGTCHVQFAYIVPDLFAPSLSEHGVFHLHHGTPFARNVKKRGSLGWRDPVPNGVTHVVVQPLQVLYALLQVHDDASSYYPGTSQNQSCTWERGLRRDTKVFGIRLVTLGGTVLIFRSRSFNWRKIDAPCRLTQAHKTTRCIARSQLVLLQLAVRGLRGRPRRPWAQQSSVRIRKHFLKEGGATFTSNLIQNLVLSRVI